MAPAASQDLEIPVEVHGSWRAPYEVRRQQYIQSIATVDVCALASHYYGGETCAEFREPKRGSYNICYFVEFPVDRARWVVRFPLTPVLHDVRRKLQCEISTMEFIASRTSIPVPTVQAYGLGGDSDTGNPTGKCFIIMNYIDGEPLVVERLHSTTTENQRRFYSHLADFYTQLRGLEFDASGAVSLSANGSFEVTPPLSVDINAISLRDANDLPLFQRTASTREYAGQLYSILLARAAEPMPDMSLLDVQYMVFALQDFKKRLRHHLSESDNEIFVLNHGDLQPSNILLDNDFGIKGIIDWEWAGTVPSTFFVPPLWLGRNIAPIPNDESFARSFSMFHQALATAGSRLASEWAEDTPSAPSFYIPAALVNQHFFMTIYFSHIFPKYFDDEKQHIRVRQFFEEDGPNGAFSLQVARLVQAGRAAERQE